MPTNKRFGKWMVRVNGPNEHDRPHFHIVGPDADFQVSMPDLTMMTGDARRVPLELWDCGHDNRDALIATFSALQGQKRR